MAGCAAGVSVLRGAFDSSSNALLRSCISCDEKLAGASEVFIGFAGSIVRLSRFIEAIDGGSLCSVGTNTGVETTFTSVLIWLS